MSAPVGSGTSSPDERSVLVPRDAEANLPGASDEERSNPGEGSTVRGEDVLAKQDLDPALNKKMHIVNNVGVACLPSLPFLPPCGLGHGRPSPARHDSRYGTSS